ncbi:MAG: S-methyl-5-thioribose-1-phosphate isomerase, partial [Firmicutes bacterium]|nr:S-methyl-5-thioribose-1-phosphate isomerase [Bacillota bacterium]
MEPIIWEGSTLKLLDQRLLPGEIKYLSCTTVEEVAEAIQKMVVRGAPAIGIAASFGLVLGAKEHGARCRFSDLQEMALKLKNTRPTAVNLAWALERLLAVAEEIKDGQAMVNALEEEAGALFKEDLAINKAIGENGAALLSPDTILLTHCNA